MTCRLAFLLDIATVKSMKILCVQRTEVMPRDRTLAEKEPAKFAALLIERLQQVKNDRDSVEKVMQSINQTKVCSRIMYVLYGLWLVRSNSCESLWMYQS